MMTTTGALPTGPQMHVRVNANLRSLLAEEGWSIPQLASRSGVSLDALRSRMRGSAAQEGPAWTLPMLTELANAFGVSAEDLLRND